MTSDDRGLFVRPALSSNYYNFRLRADSVEFDAFEKGTILDEHLNRVLSPVVLKHSCQLFEIGTASVVPNDHLFS
jgi:hypothetical protein